MKKTIINNPLRLTRTQRRTAAAFMLVCFLPTAVLALPVSPQVISGSAAIITSGSAMTITNSANAIINWHGFSIGQNESTRFLQPSAASAVLNRITGGDPSKILGALQSNGTVLLINPNGILFGPNARIDVNGLIASTLGITNQDFLAGKMNFSAGAVAGKIENQGTITTPGGGQVYLIAPDVTNSGVITAPNGDVLLAAGKEVLLVDKNNPEIAMVVSAPEHQALNLGTLAADAGRIGVYGGIVRQKGRISADSAVMEGGRIFLKATKVTTLESGSLTTAKGVKGGTVQVLGQHAGLIGDAVVDVSGTNGGGTVLVGGDYQGKNPLVLNAAAAYFGKDATIKADATENGNGGKVIIWSDDTTRAYGSISAKGGAKSGDGGFVEVSGKNSLDFIAKVDTTAPNGLLGTLLLDPLNIDVSNTAPTAVYADVSLFTAQPTTDQVIAPATLEAVGASVHLQATLNITFTDPLTLTTPGAGLTALAGWNITVNAPITTAGGVISLTANEAFHGTGLGALLISATGGLNTTGASTPTGANINLKVDSGSSSDITIAAPINAGTAGNVSLITNGAITQTTNAVISAALLDVTAGSGISLAAAINTVGNISITGTGSAGQDGIIVNAPITTTSGNILLNGTGGAGSFTSDGGRGVVVNSDISTTSGNISITGKGGNGTVYHGDVDHIGNGGSGVVIDSGTIGTTATVGAMSSGSKGIITISGTGGDGAPGDYYTYGSGGHGVEIIGASITTSQTITGAVSGGSIGTISINGTGGTGGSGGDGPEGGSGGSGVLIDSSNIASSKTLSGGTISGGTVGNVSITGTGASGGAGFGNSDADAKGGIGGAGIYVLTNTANSIISGTGDISLIGTAGNGGAASSSLSSNATGGDGGYGLYVESGSYNTSITATSTSGKVTMYGTGGAGGEATGGPSAGTAGSASGGNGGAGIYIDSVAIASNAGAVKLTGTGGAGGKATGGEGTVNDTSYGNGGNADGGRGGDGIALNNYSSITTESGNIELVGTGGSGGSGTGGDAVDQGLSSAGEGYGGVGGSGVISGSDLISSGDITVVATGGDGGVGVDGIGGFQFLGAPANGGDGGSGFMSSSYASISSTGGNISVTGNGGRGGAAFASDANYNNSGNSYGGAGGVGVSLDYGEITTSGATKSISLNGKGGAGGSAKEGGASFNGTLTDGDGGSGLYISETTLNSGVGSMTLTGKGAGGAEGLYFDIGTIIGRHRVMTGDGTSLSDPQSGNITLIAGGSGASSIAIVNNQTVGNSPIIQGTGTLSLRPLDVNTTVTLGDSGPVGGFNLDSTVLSAIKPGFSNIIVGNAAGTGKITVGSDGWMVLAANLTLQNGGSGSNGIAINGALSNEGGSVLVSSGGTITLNASVTAGGTLILDSTSLVNNAGSSALSSPSGWRVYSDSPGTDTFGLSYDFKQYAATRSGQVLGTGNGLFYRSVTPSAFTPSLTGFIGKVYDGTTVATLGATNYSLTGTAIGDDVVTLKNRPTIGSYDNKNAGFAKTLTVSGLEISALDSTGKPVYGYTLSTSTASAAIGSIDKAMLSIYAIAQDKIYDGGTAATVSLIDTNRISGDRLSVVFGSANFNDKNVGAVKTITVSGINIVGADAGNYFTPYSSDYNYAHSVATGYNYNSSYTGGVLPVSAAITARALTVSATGQNKIYDGSIAATVTLADNRIAGDVLTLNSSASFSDKNAATGKTVTISGITASGSDAGNYTFNNTAATTADISKASLTVSATGQNKIYDGSSAATVTLADNRITGDVLTLSNSSSSFSDKNAATGKTVTVSGITAGGSDAGNYTFNSTAATTADITVRPLSTWTAGTGGLWSNPANWDALPDGQNVLAVSIPSGGSYQVKYDGGATTLQNLTSSQTLLMADGTLTIGNALNTTGLQQSGGIITGAGSLKTTTTFTQSGGSINLAGTASLIQSAGNLNIADLKASAVSLISQTGGISQTGPITASSLITYSTTGTVLNSANQISHFSAANSTSGDIVLTNTASPLTIAAITQTGPGNIIINNTGATITGAEPITSGGSVSLTAHSPLTIGSGGITAVGDILLVASASSGSDTLAVNGLVASTSGGITLKAGDRVVIGTGGSTKAPSGSITTTDQTGTSTVGGTTASTAPTLDSCLADPTAPGCRTVVLQTQTSATTSIVNDISIIDTTPVAPTGLMLVTMSRPRDDSSASGSSDGSSSQTSSPSGDSGARDQNSADNRDSGGSNKDGEKDKDKNGKDKDKDKDKDSKEQQSSSGDKKDAKPKKNYCN